MNRALSIIVIFAAGCGPSISETRMVAAPAREANCHLELVQGDLGSLMMSPQWEVIGSVSLETKSADPIAESTRDVVRPRACAMGGTAIAVAVNSTATNTFGASSHAASFMVLRPRAAASAVPTTF